MATMLERATLTTPDMSCDHCVATIEKTVTALPGVVSVKADLPTKRVVIDYDPGQVSLVQIEEALDEEGYPVAK